jgi:hypothetical protein
MFKGFSILALLTLKGANWNDSVTVTRMLQQICLVVLEKKTIVDA